MTNASPSTKTELITRLPNGPWQLSVLLYEGVLYVPLDDLGSDPFIAAISGRPVRVATIPAAGPDPLVPTLVVPLADVQRMLDWLTTAEMGSIPRIPALRAAINSWIHRAGRLVDAITKLTPTPDAPAQAGADKTVPLRVSICVEGGTPELNTALGNLLLRGLDAIPGTQTDTGDTVPSPTRH